jgi:hypothetical protein
MTWQPFSAETATEAQRELIRHHMQTRILEIDFRHFDAQRAESSVELTVYGSRLRDLASTEPLDRVANQVIAAAKGAVEDAFQLLVIDTDQLPPPGPDVDIDPKPAVHLRITLHGLERHQGEASISMPDPRAFREALARGESLASIARSAVTTLGRDLEVGLRREIIDRRALSR